MTRNLFKNALLVILSVVLTLAALDIALRVSGLATDTAFHEGNQELGFKFIPNQTGRFVAGKWGNHKATYHINSDGWNSIRDYRAERLPGTKRIAVIGDSYIEALMVNPEAAMPAVLEHALKQIGRQIEVYPFGISSASASHYLAMMRYVRKRFSPDLYIINLVHSDIPDSLAVPPAHERAIYYAVRRSNGSFEEVPARVYRPHRLRRLLGHSAIARYLYVNVGIKHIFQRETQPRQFEANIDTYEMMPQADAKIVIRFIFHRYLDEAGGDRRRLVILMDTVRRPIYEGNHPSTTAPFRYNLAIAEVCRELALNCLDLTEVFWSDFQKNGRRFNTVTDNHWDEYGHKVVAAALESYLLKHDLLPHE